MKRIILFLFVGVFFLSFVSISEAENGYYFYDSDYSYSKPRNYSRGGEYRLQDGYFKNNGTYVSPHIKTYPDNYEWNNYKPRKSRMDRGLYDW